MIEQVGKIRSLLKGEFYAEAGALVADLQSWIESEKTQSENAPSEIKRLCEEAVVLRDRLGIEGSDTVIRRKGGYVEFLVTPLSTIYYNAVYENGVVRSYYQPVNGGEHDTFEGALAAVMQKIEGGRVLHVSASETLQGILTKMGES